MRYIMKHASAMRDKGGRDELEACGEAFLAQVRQQAEKLVREMAA